MCRLPIPIFLLIFLALALAESRAQSTCYGTTAGGRIEYAVQLPAIGDNYAAYSGLAHSLGRTYVHTTVAEIVTAAYAAMARASPGTRFVYGETGWKSGGPFKPHRTHQNGLSVDFFVPVRDRSGRSVPLPTGPTNKFGYGIEFDAKGGFGEYTIDFDAVGEHLMQLDLAARKRNAPIKLAIFDPRYLPKLFATKHGEYLKTNVPFLRGGAWVRHDEHYHVDFAVECLPIE